MKNQVHRWTRLDVFPKSINTFNRNYLKMRKKTQSLGQHSAKRSVLPWNTKEKPSLLKYDLIAKVHTN